MPFSQQSISLVALRYELAMLIGQDLRLEQMLRRFFTQALKLLGCRAAHVWLYTAQAQYEHRFAYPRRDRLHVASHTGLQEAIAAYALDPGSPREINLENDRWAVFFPLGELGFCLLLRADGAMPAEVSRALLAIFERLATACVACIEHEQTETLRARAEAANLAKSAFLANMSHEIRTPMNGVIGLAQVALAQTREPHTREHLRLLVESADHLLTIINDILDFSRIEAGRLAFRESRFDLVALLTDTVAQMRNAATAKGLTLALHAGEIPRGQYLGDPIRLKQVLVNLIGNGIKFTERGGIDVRAQPREDGSVYFEVEDTGIGIRPEKQREIFEAFGQADDSIVRPHDGTGLGLTICSRLVEMMHGRIGLRSEPGVGSCFWFSASLPRLEDAAGPGTEPAAGAAAATAAAAEETTALERAPTDTQLQVLVAEDNTINQRLMALMLEQMGHNSQFAADGEAAVEARSAGNFDVVLMDLHMPVLDGLSATRRIRAHEQQAHLQAVPIFALTASAMEEDREACLAAGMDGHLAKPFKRSELEQILARAASLRATRCKADTAPEPAGFGAASAVEHRHG